MQYSGVQYSAAQCMAVQYSAVQCSAVQCSAVQCSAVRYRGEWLPLPDESLVLLAVLHSIGHDRPQEVLLLPPRPLPLLLLLLLLLPLPDHLLDPLLPLVPLLLGLLPGLLLLELPLVGGDEPPQPGVELGAVREMPEPALVLHLPGLRGGRPGRLWRPLQGGVRVVVVVIEVVIQGLGLALQLGLQEAGLDRVNSSHT